MSINTNRVTVAGVANPLGYATNSPPQCPHAFPQWKCLEMGCRAQYLELRRVIETYSPNDYQTLAEQDRKEVHAALLAFQMYYPEPPLYECQ